MMMLELASEEAVLLQRIVRQYYMNLRAEIYHTDSSIYKDTLKEEEAQIQSLLDKLKHEAVEKVVV